MLKRILNTCLLSLTILTVSGQFKSYIDSVIPIDFQSLQDVSASTVLAVGGEDEYYPVAIPFPFTFFEEEQTVAYVGLNGILTFGQPYPQYDFNREKLCYPENSLAGSANGAEPTNPDYFIAAYWNDLAIDPLCDGGGAGEQAQIAYQVFGAAGSQVLVISWENVVLTGDLFPCTTGADPAYGGVIRTQIKLYEGSNNIEVHLKTNFAPEQGATIGVENADGSYANYVNCGLNADPGSDIAWLFTPTTAELPGNVAPPSAGYCQSSGIDCINSGEDDYQIISVTLGNMHNASSCDSGYTDFTNKAAVLKEGGSYNLRVKTAAFGNPVITAVAWIDWNNDTIFSADEKISLVGTDSGNLDFEGDFNGTVNVPTGLTASLFRMRVMSTSVDDSDDPCKVDTQGETEDYHIKISPISDEYCEATGWDCNAVVDPDWIEEVLIQTDGAQFANSTGCNSGYADFSSDASKFINWSTTGQYLVSVERNINYTFGFVDIWIDWNEDGNFSDDERTTIPPQQTGFWEIIIQPSLTATSGLKRMRIRGYIVGIGSEGNPSSPCGFRANGEVEDYTINFTSINDNGPLACSSYISPLNNEVVCSDSTNFVWTSVTDATNYRFTVIDTVSNTVVDEIFTADTSFKSVYVGGKYAWFVTPYSDTQRATFCDTNYFEVVADGKPVIDLSAYSAGIDLCVGADTAITSVVNMGKGPFTFAWSGIGSADLATDTDSIVVYTASALGSYDLTLDVEDQNGCFAEPATITINVVNAGDAGIFTIAADTICLGASTTATITGNNVDVLVQSSSDKITWVDLGTFASGVTLEPSSSGKFFYRAIANLNGCADTSLLDSLEVLNLPVKPIILPATDQAICLGDSVEFSTSNYTSGLTWMPGNTQASTIKRFSKGETWVIYTDMFGCSVVSDTIEVNVNAVPVAPIINSSNGTLICSGDSTILSTQTYASYLWSTGETTATVTIKTAGDYNVTVTNADGCSSVSQDISIKTGTTPSKPVITSSNGAVFCDGNMTDLSTDVSDSYLWSTGETTASITVSTSGDYSVEVSNADGCSAVSDLFSITVNPTPVKPTLVVENDTTVVCLETGTAYTWFYEGAVLVTTSDSILNVNLNGTYTVIVTNSFGCSSEPSDGALVTKVGIEQILLEDEVVVYPNPTSGVINISGAWDSFELFDLDGKRVGMASNSAKTLQLPIELKGMYILKIYSGRKVFVKKLQVNP